MTERDDAMRSGNTLQLSMTCAFGRLKPTDSRTLTAPLLPREQEADPDDALQKAAV